MAVGVSSGLALLARLPRGSRLTMEHGRRNGARNAARPRAV